MVVKVLKYVASLVYMVFTSILITMVLCDKVLWLGILLCTIVVSVMTYGFLSDKYKVYLTAQFIYPIIIGAIGFVLINTIGNKLIDTSGMFGGFALLGAYVEVLGGLIVAVFGLVVHIIYKKAINRAAGSARDTKESQTKNKKVTIILMLFVILLPVIFVGITYISNKKATRDYEKSMEEFNERQLYKADFYETNGYNAENVYPEWKEHIEEEYLYSIFDKYIEEQVYDSKDLSVVGEWFDNEENSFYIHIPEYEISKEGNEFVYKVAIKGYYWWSGNEYYNSQGYVVYKSTKDIESYYDLNATTVTIEEYKESE